MLELREQKTWNLKLQGGPRTLARGETLFRVDEEADTAYVVNEGVLVVCHSSPNGREVITSVYFPGEICAGLSVLTQSEYMGTARAPRKSKTVVTPVSRAELVQLVGQDMEIYRSLLMTQRAKQRFKDRMFLGFVADSCQQRAASALLWLHRHARPDGEGQVKLHLCRQELADLIGSAVETVVRVLSSFRKKGLITEQKGLIKMDLAALTDLSLTA